MTAFELKNITIKQIERLSEQLAKKHNLDINRIEYSVSKTFKYIGFDMEFIHLLTKFQLQVTTREYEASNISVIGYLYDTSNKKYTLSYTTTGLTGINTQEDVVKALLNKIEELSK